MKKSILTAIVAVAAVSGAIGYQSQQTAESQLSAVELANLEALTDTEGDKPCMACNWVVKWHLNMNYECYSGGTNVCVAIWPYANENEL